MISVVLRLGIEIAVQALRLVDRIVGHDEPRDQVVMISRQHRTTSGDFARIRDRITEVSPTTRVLVLNHRSTRNPVVEAARLLRQTRELGRSRAAVVDTYIIPVSVLRARPGRPVVQIWHASGAMKRFGVASIGTDEGASPAVARGMRMHRGYTAIVAGGPDAAAEFRAGFGASGMSVVECGQPRHDRFSDPAYWEAARKRVLARYADVVDRGRLVVYAPTMRRGAPIRWERLARELDAAGLTVVVCPHPLDRRTRIDPSLAVDGSGIATSDWLAVADHLVTDYSALAFDAAARRIPTWLFAYDIDDYRRSPGLFIDPVTDLAPITARTETELVALVARHDGNDGPDGPRQMWDRLRAGHWAVTDGRATARIVELLGLGDGAAPSPQHPRGGS